MTIGCIGCLTSDSVFIELFFDYNVITSALITFWLIAVRMINRFQSQIGFKVYTKANYFFNQ